MAEDVQVVYIESLLKPLRETEKDFEACRNANSELTAYYDANPQVERLSLDLRDYPNSKEMRRQFRIKLATARRSARRNRERQVQEQVRRMQMEQAIQQTVAINSTLEVQRQARATNTQEIIQTIQREEDERQTLPCPICLNESETVRPLHGTRRSHGVCDDCRPNFIRREYKCPICREPFRDPLPGEV